MVVKDEVIEIFNNLVIEDFYKREFEMQITPSVKDAIMEKFLPFERTSFLKRNFVWSERWQRFTGPLNLNSVYKSLTWSIPSSSVSREEQHFSSLQSMLWELFFHVSNPEQFHRIRLIFNHWLISAYGGLYLRDLPTYEYIATTLGFATSEDDPRLGIRDDTEFLRSQGR